MNTYIVRTIGGEDIGTKGPVDAEIWIETIAGGKSPVSGGVKKLELPVPPTSAIFYNLDLVYKDPNYIDETTTHELEAFDWNGDGWTDYVMTYVGFANGDRSYPRLVLVLIDGKTQKVYKLNDGGIQNSSRGDVVSGRTAKHPPLALRLTAGDFDGDSRPEIAIAFTNVDKQGSSYYYAIAVYKVGADYSSQCIFTDLQAGKYEYRNQVPGLAAGDINGDNIDELVYAYSHTTEYGDYDDAPGLNVRIYGRTPGGDTTFRTLTSDKQIGYTYPVQQGVYSSPLNIKVADLDNDGKGEAVLTTTIYRPKNVPFNRVLGLWVLKFESPDLAAFTSYPYDMYTSGGSWMQWVIHQNYQRHSLAVGNFDFPNPESASDEILSAVCAFRRFAGSTVLFFTNCG